MLSLASFVSPPHACSYLPGQIASQEYEYVKTMTAAEFAQRLRAGWRRFGHVLFRPACRACAACLSLRVPVASFRPSRSQQRSWKMNAADIEVRIGAPAVDRQRLRLYDRFHAFQADFKGWTLHPAKDRISYEESFVQQPFPTEEWCHYLHGKLVGVGYVDAVPEALSAIYFFYDPDQRRRALGTWNVLSIIEAARQRGVPYVYLGYYVAGCRSLEYKGNFQPNEILDEEGKWVRFLERAERNK